MSAKPRRISKKNRRCGSPGNKCEKEWEPNPFWGGTPKTLPIKEGKENNTHVHNRKSIKLPKIKENPMKYQMKRLLPKLIR